MTHYTLFRKGNSTHLMPPGAITFANVCPPAPGQIRLHNVYHLVRSKYCEHGVLTSTDSGHYQSPPITTGCKHTVR